MTKSSVPFVPADAEAVPLPSAGTTPAHHPSIQSAKEKRVTTPLPESAPLQFPSERSVLNTLLADQSYFYSRENVPEFLMVLGVSGVLANTQADQEISDWYQDDVRSEFTDSLASGFKQFGEQWYVVPVYAGASCMGRYFKLNPGIQTWGDRSLRSMLVGVPPLLFLQKAIGSSRPNDPIPSSNWHGWADDNGASGHTFVGAVPFLVAAQMTDHRVHQASLYFVSTWTGWSRINDNAHYMSQAIVGWWIAYAATRAVTCDDSDSNIKFVPMNIAGASGLGLDITY